jgi:ACT domain-containing protein
MQDNFKEIIFDVNDLKQMKKASLIFLIKDSKGSLTIKLNGHLIYQGELTNNQLPIELPKAYLKDKNNKIYMESSSPGWRIFSSNYYLLQDVKLIKVVETKKLSSIRSFYVDTSEGQSPKKLTLAYFINCNKVKEYGKLTIMLNGRLVHSDTVFCQYPDKREKTLDKSYLSSTGRNKLEFKIDKGDYNIDQASVKVEMAKSAFPKYSFEIDTDDWKDVSSGSKKVKVKFLFGDNRKRMAVTVQEDQFSLDTSSNVYTRDITSMVDNGANHLTLVPYNSFEIKSMKVFLE